MLSVHAVAGLGQTEEKIACETLEGRLPVSFLCPISPVTSADGSHHDDFVDGSLPSLRVSTGPMSIGIGNVHHRPNFFLPASAFRLHTKVLNISEMLPKTSFC